MNTNNNNNQQVNTKRLERIFAKPTGGGEDNYSCRRHGIEREQLRQHVHDQTNQLTYLYLISY
jgi:hypothetical protein